MIRAYRFLLRPTARQTAALGEMLRDHCSLYNGALQERRDAYRHASRTTVRYGDQSAQLKDIRAFDPERQGRWSFSSGQTPGYPRFKGAGHFDTVTFPKDGDGCRWGSTPHDAQTRVRLQGVGHIRVHQHRPVQGRVWTISVKREGNRWYVALACDNGPAEELPPTGAIAGIDRGIAHCLTTSDGEHLANPRFVQARADELAEAQRRLATFPKRTRQRTKRHRAAARKVAELHRKVRRRRADFHHRTARTLITDHDVIVHERLNTVGMTKSPPPEAAPGQPGSFLPNGGAAKENRVTQERFQCTACGFAAHADHVGATHVLDRAGPVLCAAA